jgi:predicted branched-subunit amino acid permease
MFFEAKIPANLQECISGILAMRLRKSLSFAIYLPGETMSIFRRDFIAGARETLPILLGVIPFATICGVAAVSVGLTPFEAIAMTLIVYAGASQLAVFQLMGSGGGWLIMVVTAWIINVRFTMYSAALAPYLQKEPFHRKAPFAYMLSDQAFGVTMSRFSNALPSKPAWYFYGSVLTVWAAWNISATAGALLGTLVPESWGFDFAFPLSFMALMFAALKNRPGAVAALAGGITAVVMNGLPYNLGLVLGALTGITAGVLSEKAFSNPQREGS